MAACRTTRRSKLAACATPRVSSDGNHALRVVMVYPCGLIRCDRCPALLGDADTGEGCPRVGAGVYGKSLRLPFNFAVPNASLKSTVFLLGKKKKPIHPREKEAERQKEVKMKRE